jgi:NitT/TauT family transport system substrate-binding protein
MSKTLKTIAIVAAGIAVLSAPSFAADKVRLVNSTKVVFETEHPYTALEEGIFAKHNLDVSIIHGSGGAASLQAVITGSQDIVWGNGVLGVLSAYAKGAPVRILGSNIRGVPDLYWYVKPESPIKTFKDLDGKQMAYSFHCRSTGYHTEVRIGGRAVRVAHTADVRPGRQRLVRISPEQEPAA